MLQFAFTPLSFARVVYSWPDEHLQRYLAHLRVNYLPLAALFDAVENPLQSRLAARALAGCEACSEPASLYAAAWLRGVPGAGCGVRGAGCGFYQRAKEYGPPRSSALR